MLSWNSVIVNLHSMDRARDWEKITNVWGDIVAEVILIEVTLVEVGILCDTL